MTQESAYHQFVGRETEKIEILIIMVIISTIIIKECVIDCNVMVNDVTMKGGTDDDVRIKIKEEERKGMYIWTMRMMMKKSRNRYIENR